MKKILIISESTGGGVRRHLLDLLNEINKTKYKVFMLYSKEGADSVFLNAIQKLKSDGIIFIESSQLERSKNLFKVILSVKELKRIVNEIKPDIIHCHSSIAGAYGRIATFNNKKIKKIYTPHAYMAQNPNLSLSKRRIFIFLEKIMNYRTDMTINVSKGEREFAVDNKITTKDKSKVIYNGINYEMPKKNKDPQKRKTIITVARMAPQKNPKMFIDIANKVLKKNKNCNFIYVGDGPLFKEMQSYINSLNLMENIQLVGFKKNVEHYLLSSDLYLSTSLYEGMPYSLIEAVANKLPIVATNVIGNNEIVEDGFNGYLVSIDNVNEAAERIIELLSDDELRHKLSENSFIKYSRDFSLGQMIKKIESVYDSF